MDEMYANELIGLGRSLTEMIYVFVVVEKSRKNVILI